MSAPVSQCPSTCRTRSGFVFCTLDAGHEGEHRGFRKRWPNGNPPVTPAPERTVRKVRKGRNAHEYIPPRDAAQQLRKLADDIAAGTDYVRWNIYFSFASKAAIEHSLGITPAPAAEKGGER